MSSPIVREYVSIGGNRHSAASAWSRVSGEVAFGADQNVAIWKPLGGDSKGVVQLLHGHKDKVTALAFQSGCQEQLSELLFSGSADGKLSVWRCDPSDKVWHLQSQVDAHTGALNSIATLPGSKYFVTGGADSKIRIWKISRYEMLEVLTILPKPRLIPLTLVLGSFPGVDFDEGLFLAAGGTRNDIQVYALQDLARTPKSEHQATLSGHEGWIRSLCLKATDEHGLLLASASHDKYVRLWKFVSGDTKVAKLKTELNGVTLLEPTLTAKVQTVAVAQSKYSITFEALLLGHEDWIYSAMWNPVSTSEQLLTASADGTLTIWELDSTSGIWISTSKLGEISGQKGATTATGSSGGFWTALWSPDGQSVACLGRTGSWRIWHYDQGQQYWVQNYGISGHVSAANSLSWSPDGDYLLSTSSDQTTRLHAEWKRSQKRTWHEFSRPQIHGYDLNCISSTGHHQFTSGADEKLLRVFNEPKDIAKMLKNLCEIKEPDGSDLSDSAAIPVLGLSNKAIVDGEGDMTETNGNREPEYITPDQDISLAALKEPPTEDLLARHTLWPEHEKLYGHGYEISESAYSSDNHILATSCKASSIDHAVIRLYDTKDWNEIKPALTAHSLTVTSLSWSPAPNNLLLSVGRDRQWSIFKEDDTNKSWKLLQSNPKAHTRMILDACWSQISSYPFFVTAGRDKMVKLWRMKGQSAEGDSKFEEWLSIKRETAVTALSVTSSQDDTLAVLAVGEDSGALSIHVLYVNPQWTLKRSIEIDSGISPSKAVTRIAWRPRPSQCFLEGHSAHLAVAAADGSVSILAVNVEELCR